MSKVDWIVVAFVALTGFSGYRRGLVGTALAFAGVVVGAIVGSRVAPHLLAGGSKSGYTALVGLVGAAIGAVAFRIGAAIAARFVRGGLRLVPPLHLLDSLGGLVVGVLTGLVVAWVAGAVALQIPGHGTIRRDVKRSVILKRLNKIAPPHDVLHVRQELGMLEQRL